MLLQVLILEGFVLSLSSIIRVAIQQNSFLTICPDPSLKKHRGCVGLSKLVRVEIFPLKTINIMHLTDMIALPPEYLSKCLLLN